MQQKQHYAGLTDAQVEASRQQHGANILTPAEKEPLWRKLLASFGDPIIRILLVALAMSVAISIYQFVWTNETAAIFFEPAGILLAVLLATMVGFALELKNEKTFQSLNEVNDETLVKVIRNGNVCQVERRNIVVGDTVLLETGEEIPADCRLLESLNLTVNESSLTGELLCAKTTDPAHFDSEATYPSDQIMKGTTITEGYCTAEVIRVGDATESGKVFQAAQVEEGKQTPLGAKLQWLAAVISKMSYAVAVIIVVGRMGIALADGRFSNDGGTDWLSLVKYALDTLMIAITLIVVSVPEGLPMSVTLSLAFSMKKLMKQNTLPRTMHSCETMGATSVICTDKTGTLTQNRMTVYETHFPQLDGQRLGQDDFSRLLAEAIAMNTTANLDLTDPTHIAAVGNPTEGALLLWLHQQGADYQSLRDHATVEDRLPFTTELKYMATVTRSAVLGQRVLYVKGAPEMLMQLSDLSAAERQSYSQRLLGYQSKAMRTLGFAFLPLSADDVVISDGRLSVSGLQFLGVAAISDPVRQDVPAAIRDCLGAGIQVKIVTGDTPGTAKEIGRQVGLWTDGDSDDNIITGQDFAAMSDEQLYDRIGNIKIMSRARPTDKERLVRMLQRQGHVVAVTGDGTNDAPALNAADVGLSMGDGTAVAKEASDMTILDSSFATISNAVMWGRSLYKNIQRFVTFQMTINVAACLIVLVGAFTGTQSPLTVTQMLWVNLIMDTFAALALASLPPSKAVMQEKPRRVSDSIITRPMAWQIIGVGGFFFVLLLALLLFFQHADIHTLYGADLHLTAYNDLNAHELSLFFTIFVMLQFWNLFNAKAFMTGKSAFANLSQCRLFLTIVAVVLVGQVAIVELGGQLFNVCHLPLSDWLLTIGATSVVLWAGELMRLFSRTCRSTCSHQE